MKTAMLVFIQTVQTQHVGHAFSLSDGSARSEDGDHGTPNFDVGRAPKRFHSQLWEIGAQADLAFPVRYDWALVGLLRLGREVGLSNPSNAKAKSVSAFELLKIILHHRGFGGKMPLFIGRLGDGEEDVMLHAHSPFAPYRHGS